MSITGALAGSQPVRRPSLAGTIQARSRCVRVASQVPGGPLLRSIEDPPRRIGKDPFETAPQLIVAECERESLPMGCGSFGAVPTVLEGERGSRRFVVPCEHFADVRTRTASGRREDMVSSISASRVLEGALATWPPAIICPAGSCSRRTLVNGRGLAAVAGRWRVLSMVRQPNARRTESSAGTRSLKSADGIRGAACCFAVMACWITVSFRSATGTSI